MSDEELKPAPENSVDDNSVDENDETNSYTEDAYTEDAPVDSPTPTLVAEPQNTAYQKEAVEEEAEREQAATGEPQEVEVEFTITQMMDEQRQKTPGGIYGDDVARQQNELNAARAENREPNFENLPPAPGQQVITTETARKQFPNAVPVVSFTAPVVVGVPKDTDQFATDDDEDAEDVEAPVETISRDEMERNNLRELEEANEARKSASHE